MTALSPARKAEIEELIDAAMKIQGVRDLLAELRRREWQPIETAPKDGQSQILAFVPTYYQGNGGIVVATRSGCSWYDNGAWLIEPTHWQPLPEPPER